MQNLFFCQFINTTYTSQPSLNTTLYSKKDLFIKNTKSSTFQIIGPMFAVISTERYYSLLTLVMAMVPVLLLMMVILLIRKAFWAWEKHTKTQFLLKKLEVYFLRNKFIKKTFFQSFFKKLANELWTVA